MRWGVEIQRTGLERRNLEDLLTGLGFSIVDNNGNPAVTSEEMSKCTTAAEALAVGKRLRAAMAGPARIDPTFDLGCVLEFSQGPPMRHLVVEIHCSLGRLSTRATATVSPPNNLTGRALEAWEAQRAENEYQQTLEAQRARLEPAFRSENAAKVMELLSDKAPTGVTLWKIMELMKGEKPWQEFRATYGLSEDGFKRFGDAVHNAAVTGDWARHARKQQLKSDQPMSKAEAEALVRRLADQWLADVRKGET